jgi:hypothetical protein
LEVALCAIAEKDGFDRAGEQEAGFFYSPGDVDFLGPDAACQSSFRTGQPKFARQAGPGARHASLSKFLGDGSRETGANRVGPRVLLSLWR